MEVGAFFRALEVKPIRPAKHFTHYMSPEGFPRPTRSTGWACNGYCEISLPTVRGLCPLGRSRCSPTRSRVGFLMAGISLPPLGHPAGLPWLYSSPFPTFRIQSHHGRSCPFPNYGMFGTSAAESELLELLSVPSRP